MLWSIWIHANCPPNDGYVPEMQSLVTFYAPDSVGSYMGGVDGCIWQLNFEGDLNMLASRVSELAYKHGVDTKVEVEFLPT